MKKRFLMMTALVASFVTMADAAVKPYTFWVFATATGTDTDRESAISQAVDNATQQANAMCTGTVLQVVRTGTTCLGGSDDNPYNCIVFVKASCKIGN